MDGTTTDRAMLTIALVFAALTRTLIHDRVQAGLARARAQGCRPKRWARCTPSSRRRQPTAWQGEPDRLGAFAAGADDHIPVPRRPSANVPDCAREVWGAHPLRTFLRTPSSEGFLIGAAPRYRSLAAAMRQTPS
ncbi:hypothetical protein ACFQS7_30790, partial [Dankookia sp. GCM10030260]|uniref:hypothetical protein n=1 Tax=Dankookia sp. GCM10030260 TaxID=3273390 RepID=UPI0036242E24